MHSSVSAQPDPVEDPLQDDTARPQRSPQRAVPARPEEFVGARCRCGGEDVTDRVAGLVAPFLACKEQRCHDGIASALLEQAEDFAGWADNAGCHELAAALRAGADDFRAIYDSPLDVDEATLSILWNRLRGELAKLTVSASDGQVKRSATTKPCARRDAGVSASPTEQVERTRLLQVEQGQLTELLEQAVGLSVTAGLFEELQTRVAETGHSGQQFVVPTQYVLEIVKIDPRNLRTIQGRRTATIRG